MDASVCGTMALFTCGVHIDSICIHARFRVCSSLLGVDSGALSCRSLSQYWLGLRKASGPNYTLGLHFSVGCGRRVRSPLKSRTSVRKERGCVAEEPPEHLLQPLPSDWPAGGHLITFFPPPRSALLLAKHTHPTCLQKEKVNTKKALGRRNPQGASQGCLSLPACVCVRESASHFHTGGCVTRQDPPPVLYPACLTIPRSSADVAVPLRSGSTAVTT